MTAKGWFQLADRYGLEPLVLDELSVDRWQYFSAKGTHWQQGFAFAKPALEAGAIVNTCCLKTHGGIRSFTLSLKNSVGLVAKYVPGDRFNYMNDLHTSPHIQQMIAEIFDRLLSHQGEDLTQIPIPCRDPNESIPRKINWTKWDNLLLV